MIFEVIRRTKEYIGKPFVNIEAARPLASRINERNMITVLQEMGKKDQYFLSSNGRIVKRGFNGKQGKQRNETGTQH